MYDLITWRSGNECGRRREVNNAKAYVTNYEIPLEFLMGVKLVYY